MTCFARASVWIGLVALLAAALPAGRSSVAAGLIAQATQATSGTAVIAGQLLDAGSGAPIASAIVSLARAGEPRPAAGGRGSAASETPRVMADVNGRFVFHSVPAGIYSLTATRSGYAPASLTQTQPAGSARRLQLADGQRLVNVTMTMWKEPRISGTLVDEAGEPAVGASVKLIVREGPSDARRYRVRESATADDRGVFRFGSLVPGDYLVFVQLMVPSIPLEIAAAYVDALGAGPVSANQVRADVTASGGVLATGGGTRIGDQLIQRPTNSFQAGVVGPVQVRPDGRTWVYPTTFYPGVPTIAGATLITLKPGEERIGINFSVKPVPAVRVSGTVTGSSGPAPNLAVMIVPAGIEGSIGTPSFGGEVAQAISGRNGTFVAPAVPAGDYVASVIRNPSAGETLVWGRTPVRVGDTNVDGVAIQLAPGATVSGRVEFEAGMTPAPAPAILQRGRIVIRALDSAPAMNPSAATIAADGTFQTRANPPGKYSLTMTLTAPEWALKSVMAGGRDVLDVPLDLTSADVTGVIVMFTDKAGEIAGAVTSTASEASALVVLAPLDARGQVNAGRLRNAAVGDDGSYRLVGVLPGEYFVVAVPGTVDVQDTTAMATIARRGTRVTIGEREKRSLSLDVVRGRQP